MPDMARYDPFAPTYDHPLVNSSPDFGSRSTPFRTRTIGDLTAVAPHTSFRERNKRLKSLDEEKNQLIEDLLLHLESTQSQLDRLQLEYNREINFTQTARQEHASMREQLDVVKSIMDRNPFISVLIDGDATIFHKDLISKGEKGGKEAADAIHSAINYFCSQYLPHLDAPKVFVRIYANLKSLAENLSRLKIIAHPSHLDDFIRAFNTSQSTFDLVDAGTRPESTKEKLVEQFKTSLYDCHCHQIVLGVDGSYAPMLGETLKDPAVINHITLLETQPFDKNFDSLKNELKVTRIDGIFMTTKLALSPISSKGPLQAVTATLPTLTRVESNGTAGTASSASTPAITWASMTAQALNASAPPSKASTTRTSTPNSLRSPEPTAAKPVTKIIERNRAGQRIDKVDTTIPNHEIQRIKKLKLCNIFYLQGASYCTTNNCSHSHSYPLSKGERNVLREVARMTPCYYKMDCSDPECIYGHRCPQNKPDDGGCWYGPDCRFYGWGHGIDTRVVKTTRV
ncbi:hypothetical protein PV10_04594 [Exophiala mesophila]|uniref:C3H1-type domain-containing protein n=1 Tax=Exophiala mesophila TaxID=212818 RepID=A0A0D1ZHR6_EXOME|nr:uncharacterized protein PV10_04594 [Exophiala mesophila]KIV93379.1 hypothetical protein PV10_04594 [Exophiala mesophila]